MIGSRTLLLPIRGLSRASWLILGVALLHLILAWIMRTPGLGWGEDDAAFVLLSRELQSLRYHETQDILAPIQARFPPVFPAMLAMVGALVGNRIEPLIAFVTLCSAVSIVFLFDAARRAVGDEVAFIATTLYAINPLSLADAGSLMSEAPFKLFAILALWGASRDAEGTRFAVVTGAATILAALTRTAGVAFIPALGAYWLYKRRYSWLAGLALASLPVVAWLLFSFNAPDPTDRRLYVSDLRGRHDTPGVEIADRLRDVWPRIERYLTHHIPSALAVPTIPGTVIDNAVWLGSMLVFGAIGLYALLRRWLLLVTFLAAYCILLAVWAFTFERLVRPIIPLLFLAVLLGVSTLVGTIAPRFRRLAVSAMAAVLAAGAIGVIGPELKDRLACDRSVPANSEPCWPVTTRELLSLANWVRDSTPPDALFFVSKERAFYFHSGRKSINQDRGLREDSASIGPYLRMRGVSYTVLTPIGVKATEHTKLIQSACREFEVVKQISRRTMLLRVVSETAASDSTLTCAAMRQFDAP